MDFLASFSGTRNDIFAKAVRYIDENLDETLEKFRRNDVSKNKFIFVDLGNIHDAFPKINTFKETHTIRGFADKLYNGPGVNPPGPSHISIVKAKNSSRNAADVHILWNVFEICTTCRNSEIHIITKDKGFYELAEIAKVHSVLVHFHSSTESCVAQISPTQHG